MKLANLKKIKLSQVKNLIIGSSDPVAVDIGTNSVKSIEIARPKSSSEAIDVRNFRIVSTPDNCLLSTYTENPIINPTALQDSIDSLVASTGLWNRNALVMLYDSAVVINWLSISGGEESELVGLVEEKLSTFLPTPTNEWFIDFQVLEEKKDSKTIISEAIRRDNLLEFGRILQDSGLNIVTIDSSSFNLLNVFHRYLSDKENSKKNIAVVNMGHNNTSVMIMKEGTLKSQRNLGVGGKDFTQNIMDAKGIRYEEAEKYKQDEIFFLEDPTEEQNRNENYNIIKPSFGKLIKGLYDSFDHYLAKFREFKIHEILISGGGANFRNINVLIHRHLNIPVKQGADVIHIKYQGQEMMPVDKNTYAPAIGALLRELQ
ncbi:MAG: pilus assembly protein PilM [Candidatus Wallbacteria bacterium]|nr:pilus assembly protein PilM [Candidatus Wallbacteria bacterium]